MAAEVIAVRPGPPLTGTVTVDGSKNVALPLVAALGKAEQHPCLHRHPDHARATASFGLARLSVAKPTMAVTLPTATQHTLPQLPQAARIRAPYYLVPATGARHEPHSGQPSAAEALTRPWWSGRELNVKRAAEQHYRSA